MALRLACSDYLKKKDHLKAFIDEDEEKFEDYVERIRDEFEWAGYFELYCMSLLLEVNFVIVLKDLEIISISHYPQDQVRTLFLGFHEDEENGILEHYSSLRALDDKEENGFSEQICLNIFTAKDS